MSSTEKREKWNGTKFGREKWRKDANGRVQTAQKVVSGVGSSDWMNEHKNIMNAEKEHCEKLWSESVEQTEDGQEGTITVYSIERLEETGQMASAYANIRCRRQGY